MVVGLWTLDHLCSSPSPHSFCKAGLRSNLSRTLQREKGTHKQITSKQTIYVLRYPLSPTPSPSKISLSLANKCGPFDCEKRGLCQNLSKSVKTPTDVKFFDVIAELVPKRVRIGAFRNRLRVYLPPPPQWTFQKHSHCSLICPQETPLIK